MSPSAQDARVRRHELLLRSGIVVTQDAAHGVLPAGDVLVEGDRIVAIAPRLDAADAEVVDCSGHIVLPGLINAHMHTWQTALRSVAANWTLLEYFRHVHAGLATVFVPEDIHIATLAGALNQLDHGVTTLVDWAHNNPTPAHTDAGVEALQQSGIRAAFFHGSPKPDPKPGEPHFSEVPHPRAEIERLLKGPLSDRNALVTLGMAVLGPHYSTLEVSAHDFALAKELGLIASMHQGGGEAKTPGGWESADGAGAGRPAHQHRARQQPHRRAAQGLRRSGRHLLHHARERDGAGPRPSDHRPPARAGLGAVDRRRSRIGDRAATCSPWRAWRWRASARSTTRPSGPGAAASRPPRRCPAARRSTG